MLLTNVDVLVESTAAHRKPTVSRAFDVITRRAVVEVPAAAVVVDALPRGRDPAVSRGAFDFFSHAKP
jgi:hypothetical protein